MSYLHNIVTDRDASINVDTATAQFGVQVAVGTAPINLLDDPAKAVNVPIVARNMKEAKAAIGYSTDTDKYTLMQTVIASFKKFAVAPVVFINVLDPTNASHTTAVTATEFTLTGGKTKIDVEGILLDSIVVTYGEEYGSTAVVDTDYIVSFDLDGKVDVAATSDGALASVTSIKIAYSKLNPAGVTATDIVGGLSQTGVRTGVEVIDEVYPRLGIIPSILSAPGFSSTPGVAAALDAKAELMSDLVSGVAVVDLPAGAATNYKGVAAAKTALGVESRWTTACYPMVKVDGKVFAMSSMVSALLQYLTIAGGNIPSESQDNKNLRIDAICTSDGNEVILTQTQVNDYINAYGVVSALYLNGWKCWGSNTTAYPTFTEPNNRFTKNVMISNYLEDRFKTEYLPAIGTSGSTKLMDSIVTNFNSDLNALVPDVLAGAYVVFNKDENPMSEILEGRWHFHTYYADWIPTEYIENMFTWDSSILEAAFSEGGE